MVTEPPADGAIPDPDEDATSPSEPPSHPATGRHTTIPIRRAGGRTANEADAKATAAALSEAAQDREITLDLKGSRTAGGRVNQTYAVTLLKELDRRHITNRVTLKIDRPETAAVFQQASRLTGITARLVTG